MVERDKEKFEKTSYVEMLNFRKYYEEITPLISFFQRIYIIILRIIKPNVILILLLILIFMIFVV